MNKSIFNAVYCCCVGFMGTTIGHYASEWFFAYIVVMFMSFCLGIAIDIVDEK
jgi:hypothetical protein